MAAEKVETTALHLVDDSADRKVDWKVGMLASMLVSKQAGSSELRMADSWDTLLGANWAVHLVAATAASSALSMAVQWVGD